MITASNDVTSPTQQKLILIVEDDDSLREMLSDHLKRNNFRTIAAIDGDDALNKIIKQKPDLIVLDIILPKMSGVEVLHIIRKHDWGKKLPVIVLTNNDDINVVNESIKHGVECHYIKSNTSLTTLLHTIQKELKESI